MSEHDEQAALFDWVRIQERSYPEYRWVYATPNGGHRHISVAVKLKNEGVRKGVFDIFWPIGRHGFKGIYIEIKYGKNRLTDEQMLFMAFIEKQGYAAKVFYDWLSAAKFLKWYYKGEQNDQK